MPVTMLAPVEFSKIPALNFVIPVVSADPTGYEAGLIYNSTSKEIKYHNGTSWVALGPAGAGGPPTGSASGDLTGSYPGPTVVADAITNTKLANMAANSLKGNNTGSAADPADLSVASVKTMLAYTKSDVGLGSVDNTADTAKPVSTAQQTALNLKVDTARIVSGGNGLVGGGDLTTDRALQVGSGTGITVNADDVAINRTLVDTWYLPFSGGTLTNFLTLHADPTADTHAATKRYVDLTAQGLDYKNSVKAATTANITLSGTQTVDGIALVANDRVLVKDQSTAAQNGIYLVAAGAWTRTTDADANGEISDGSVVPVEQGTANGDVLWMCTATGATPWVPGSSTSTWTRFGGVTAVTAGAGLTLNGSSIDLVATNTTLTVNANDVGVNTAVIQAISAKDQASGYAGLDGSSKLAIAQVPTGTSGTTVALGNHTHDTVYPKHFAGDVPAGTSCVVTHNLNTRDVTVEVYRNSGSYDTVICDVTRTSVNAVTLTFATSVSAGAFRCVVTGK